MNMGTNVLALVLSVTAVFAQGPGTYHGRRQQQGQYPQQSVGFGGFSQGTAQAPYGQGQRGAVQPSVWSSRSSAFGQQTHGRQDFGSDGFGGGSSVPSFGGQQTQRRQDIGSGGFGGGSSVPSFGGQQTQRRQDFGSGGFGGGSSVPSIVGLQTQGIQDFGSRGFGGGSSGPSFGGATGFGSDSGAHGVPVSSSVGGSSIYGPQREVGVNPGVRQGIIEDPPHIRQLIGSTVTGRALSMGERGLPTMGGAGAGETYNTGLNRGWDGNPQTLGNQFDGMLTDSSSNPSPSPTSSHTNPFRGDTVPQLPANFNGDFNSISHLFRDGRAPSRRVASASSIWCAWLRQSFPDFEAFINEMAHT